MSPYRHDRETRIRVLEDLLDEASGGHTAPRRREPPPDVPLPRPRPIQQRKQLHGGDIFMACIGIIAVTFLTAMVVKVIFLFFGVGS